MSNVDQIYTTLDQDRELSTAIGKFKNKPYALQQFLQSQQDKVFKEYKRIPHLKKSTVIYHIPQKHRNRI